MKIPVSNNTKVLSLEFFYIFSSIWPPTSASILNQTVLNIMYNYIPNEDKTVCPREPEWFNNNIKKLLRNQNKLFKRYKNNGYKNEDKITVDRLRNECQEAIVNAKEKYLMDLGATAVSERHFGIISGFL